MPFSQDPRQSYAEREEWSDVTPISQPDPGVQVLVPILYPQEYKEAMDYFRACALAGEHSKRVLDLTEHIIRMNPAHYTIWQYRYQTLLKTNASIEAELELTDEIATKHMKNYQAWHHRRLLLTQLSKSTTPPPSDSSTPSELTTRLLKELEFTAHVLSQDTKNYHTWAFRQWILAEFNQPALWEHELEYVDSLLLEDVRNNSAWHHRYFVLWETGVRAGEEDRENVLRQEIIYTKDKISLAPNNASPWNYIRGVLSKTHTALSTLEEFVIPYTKPSADQVTLDNDTVDLENPLPSKKASLPAPLAIEFLADIYLEKGGDDMKAKAVELFISLEKEHDTIRKKYWQYRQRNALKSTSSGVSPPDA